MAQPPTAHELWTQAVLHAEKQFGTNYARLSNFYRQLLLASMLDVEERDAEIAALTQGAEA